MTRATPEPESPASQALNRLLAGNSRFVSGERTFLSQATPGTWAARRNEVLAGQKPFAAILSCSDSRVVPEIIFGQGLGDLFVVRVAGNIVGDALRASLEYAVYQLAVPFILVLGHTGCGAIQAALSGVRLAGLSALLDAIEPAIAIARLDSGSILDNTVRANVALSVVRLEGIQGVEVGGAVYDLASGWVELL